MTHDKEWRLDKTFENNFLYINAQWFNSYSGLKIWPATHSVSQNKPLKGDPNVKQMGKCAF